MIEFIWSIAIPLIYILLVIGFFLGFFAKGKLSIRDSLLTAIAFFIIAKILENIGLPEHPWILLAGLFHGFWIGLLFANIIRFSKSIIRNFGL